jgi:nucleotide-binding universal stress UspA family protein
VRILLAMDESECSQAAMRLVIREMRPEDSEVYVLHVAAPKWLVWDYDLGELSQIEAAREETLKRGQELLERVKPQIAKAGFKVRAAMEEGDARFVIVDQAAAWKAGLIVLGSHGRKGLGRLLLGSVAEHVARHAHCSVLIMRLENRSE